MNITQHSVGRGWNGTAADWLAPAIAFALLIGAFFPGLRELVGVWNTQEEYSFGYFVPFVTLYLLWGKRKSLAAMPFSGNWAGTALVAIALLLLGIGRLSTLGTVVQYAFLLSFFGLTLAYTGWPAFRAMALPFAILVFMVPLPNYLLRELSAVLQLWSSQLGVGIIRAFGISVYLEGNVIDLGALKLQVVEACSGLRYLIPLMTLGFIAACLFRAPLWKRAVLFLSTIPITLLMNSARIGLIGVLAEYFGKSMALGFLHDFEGWAVFMVCTGVLVLEILLLANLGKRRVRLSEVFGLEQEDAAPRGVAQQRRLTLPFIVAASLVGLAACFAQFATGPVHEAPTRKSFTEFPLSLQQWRGYPTQIEADYLRELKLDDYLLADYSASDSLPVNLYVSYYASQTDGTSAHSPRACIPGDGWEIDEFGERELSTVDFNGHPLRVNRVVIRKGENQQLVYYWFQQRGRIATNEYAVKLQIFWDAITRHRSDGAMVRLVARLRPGEPDSAGDGVLERFARLAVPELSAYVPD
jgi:exosortase D (VPLPA-CTERM-specific)